VASEDALQQHATEAVAERTIHPAGRIPRSRSLTRRGATGPAAEHLFSAAPVRGRHQSSPKAASRSAIDRSPRRLGRQPARIQSRPTRRGPSLSVSSHSRGGEHPRCRRLSPGTRRRGRGGVDTQRTDIGGSRAASGVRTLYSATAPKSGSPPQVCRGDLASRRKLRRESQAFKRCPSATA
jgi:hypothetical protein